MDTEKRIANGELATIVKIGDEADLTELPAMRHHYMDGGPYVVMATVSVDRETGIYNTSYHRMEIKGPLDLILKPGVREDLAPIWPRGFKLDWPTTPDLTLRQVIDLGDRIAASGVRMVPQ